MRVIDTSTIRDLQEALHPRAQSYPFSIEINGIAVGSIAGLREDAGRLVLVLGHDRTLKPEEPNLQDVSLVMLEGAEV